MIVIDTYLKRSPGIALARVRLTENKKIKVDTNVYESFQAVHNSPFLMSGT